jgi:hypothetical protein
MGDPETLPEDLPAPGSEPGPENNPEIAGASLGRRKPDAVVAPVTDPDIPELQDRRRPQP